MSLPGYDAWKTQSPDDGYCEFCGVHERQCRKGWQPESCTGECGVRWRDPDAEYERNRDDAELEGEYAEAEDDQQRYEFETGAEK